MKKNFLHVRSCFATNPINSFLKFNLLRHFSQASLVAFIFIIAINSGSAQATWIGPNGAGGPVIGGDYNIAANWDTGTVPGAGENVTIEAPVCPITITSTMSISINSTFNVGEGVTLNISGNNPLFINSAGMLNNEGLIIVANTGTGTTITISGQLTNGACAELQTSGGAIPLRNRNTLINNGVIRMNAPASIASFRNDAAATVTNSRTIIAENDIRNQNTTAAAYSGAGTFYAPAYTSNTNAASQGTFPINTMDMCPEITSTATEVCLGASITIAATAGGMFDSETPGVAAIDATTGVITTVSPGTACITYTANGCVVVKSIRVYPLPVANAGADQEICAGESTMIGVAATAGTAPYTYAWDNGAAAVATPTVMPAVTTTYKVTVTDAKNCTDTDEVTVTVNPLPIAVAGADQSICSGGSATIGGTATGGTGPYTYAWDNGAAAVATPTVMPTTTTTYTVTVTDANNCTATDAVIITVNPATTPIFTQLGPYCVGDTPAMLPTTSTNGIAGTWNAPVTTTAVGNTTFTFTPTSTANPACAQTTTMTINVMDCTAMTTAVINEPSIYDPCFCGNPLNITGANQEVILFADFVLISGAAAGDTWILSSVNAGDALDADGNPISVGTPLTDLGGGSYRLDLFHNPDVGFNATFTGIRADGTPYATPLSVGGSCSPCPLIPTMSQWGLLIFGLLILNLAVGLISEKRSIENILR